MILFRALNDLDIATEPSKNGLASKELIYRTTKRYLYNTKRETIEKLSTKDKEEYIKNYMNKYLLDHKYKLDKIFKKEHKQVRNTIHKFVEEKDNFAYCQIIKDLSSLPNHLVNGSKTYTNWISTTNNFDCLWKYYDRQKIHEVAVLNVATNGVFDENTYIVDLSNKEVIDKIRFLSNKIDNKMYNNFIKIMQENPDFRINIKRYFNKIIMNPTNKKFMGFNFATSSKEYSIFEHIPNNSILSILEALQIDLVCADMLNENFYSLKPRKQLQELERLKNIMLRHIKEENNPYMLYVFDELYLKKHNIKDITSSPKEEQQMLLMRNKILNKSQRLPSILIKRKN